MSLDQTIDPTHEKQKSSPKILEKPPIKYINPNTDEKTIPSDHYAKVKAPSNQPHRSS
ncbi:MAG: hypothetical protein S4CHLAM20_12270 [Chlamydiia bacterium]|nr:hypothetical protein [Chlamydiia bacterium]